MHIPQVSHLKNVQKLESLSGSFISSSVTPSPSSNVTQRKMSGHFYPFPTAAVSLGVTQATVSPTPTSTNNRLWATQLNDVLEMSKQVSMELYHNGILLLSAQEKTHLAVAEQIDQLLEENAQLKEENAMSKDEVEGFQTENARLVGQNGRLVQKNADLRQEMLIIEDRLSETTENMQAFRLELDALKAKAASLLSSTPSSSSPDPLAVVPARSIEPVQTISPRPFFAAPRNTHFVPSLSVFPFSARVRPTVVNTVNVNVPTITLNDLPIAITSNDAVMVPTPAPSVAPVVPTLAPSAAPVLHSGHLAVDPAQLAWPPFTSFNGDAEREGVHALRRRVREVRRRERAREPIQSRGQGSRGIAFRAWENGVLDSMETDEGQTSEGAEGFEMLTMEDGEDEDDVHLV